MFHQSGGCCDGSSPMCYPRRRLHRRRPRRPARRSSTSATRRAGVDLRPAVRGLEAHPAGHRRGARPRRRVQPGSPGGHAVPQPRPGLHRRREARCCEADAGDHRRRLRARRTPGDAGGRFSTRPTPRTCAASWAATAVVVSVIPLPRPWLLASAMLVGSAVGLLAGVAFTVLVQARVRPGLVDRAGGRASQRHRAADDPVLGASVGDRRWARSSWRWRRAGSGCSSRPGGVRWLRRTVEPGHRGVRPRLRGHRRAPGAVHADFDDAERTPRPKPLAAAAGATRREPRRRSRRPTPRPVGRAPAQPVAVPGQYQYLKWWTVASWCSSACGSPRPGRAGPVLLVVPLDRQDAGGVHGAGLRRRVRRGRRAAGDGRGQAADVGAVASR